ncbi:MAG: transporter substrate-binding domain-containing protein [Clostridia bacterium]|nr:transporter substrate-binding domain-containing protein [Clostridia bacterium]
MSKRILINSPAVAVLAGLMMFFIGLPSALAQQDVGLEIQGNLIGIEPAPFINANRVMVPVRAVADHLGAKVTWDEENKAVKVDRDEFQIAMVLGRTQAVVNGQNVQLESTPVIVAGRAMVPVRVLAEGLQVPVSWSSETRVVSLGKPTLVAGSSLTFPPFEFKEGNDIVGFDVDLIQAIGELWGEEIIVKDIPFNQLIPSLSSGQIDLIISGLTITENRQEFMNLTMPYFDYGEIILTPKGSHNDMTLEDLTGKVACQMGSSAQGVLTGLAEKDPPMQIVPLETLEEVWRAVELGIVDAALVPHAPTAYYLTQHGDSNLIMVGNVLASQPTGIAVQKGNQKLVDKLNQSLKTLKENGTYDHIYEKWLGPRK